jgi:hypothetical protein
MVRLRKVKKDLPAVQVFEALSQTASVSHVH